MADRDWTIMDRRGFVRLAFGAAAARAVSARTGAGPARGEAQATGLHRWFPRVPLPREIWTLPFAGDVEEGMLLETAAGLAARAALRGGWRALIYETVDNDGYQRWFAAYCRAHHPIVRRMGLDEAVVRLKRAGVIRGYLLYRFEQSARALHSDGPLDESANAATSLAARHRAVAISERLVERARAAGLEQIADVREMSEAQALETGAQDYSRDLIGTADPKTRNVRSLMVALGAFCCSGRGAVYERAMARCLPDTPVLGWGCGAEDRQTIPSTRHGMFQTATNWCHNLPVFASEAPGAGIAASELRIRRSLHWSELDWGEGRHHASFMMSDGDNVQWLMGNFTGGSEAPSYYGSPLRGRAPMGWGVCAPSLAQLSPRTLAEVLGRATRSDDFALFSGGGYIYPDLFGQARSGEDCLTLDARRLNAYMRLTGIRILAYNFQEWDSSAALAACATYAREMPGLLGILAFQYYPYSAGDGEIRWVRGHRGEEVPVVSCRLCVWAQTGRPRDTTPAGVATWLNRMPTANGAATDGAFSWVIAHAWSRFRRAAVGEAADAEERGVSQDQAAPGTARGYEPALWAIERLAPQVKAVTPQELLLRVRLRLRPAAELARCRAEVRRRAGPHPSPSAAAKLARASALLVRAQAEPAAARECFDLLRATWRALPGAAHPPPA